MRLDLCLPTLLFLLEALVFRAKFAVEPVAATSVARAARAASSKQQKWKPERDEEQTQQEEETASKSSELRQASATRSHQADDSDEDDGENDSDSDTPTSSADLLSRARHIVGSYIDTAEAGIPLSDSTRAGLQLLSTRTSYVHGVAWRCVGVV
jgi:hypothetical protein